MTKTVKIGNVIIGGGNKVAIQSMANIKTADVERVCLQINKLARAGCDIMRVSVKDVSDAEAIKEIKKNINCPLVADVHFDYKLALKAVENGADKVRINPGNIGGEANIKAVAECVKYYNVPIRVGSNSGSIEKKFLNKYGRNEIALAESALEKAGMLEKYGVENIVISAKASDAALTVKTYRYLSKKTNYPLHVGVTEAGTNTYGVIKSSIGIGSLILDGIGDTIRVSLTANPIEEIFVAKRILRASGIDNNYVEVISCPTCGRTEYDCIGLAERVEKLTQNIEKPLKIAVMGCIVNGVGEAANCDLGVAGSKEYCVIFKGKDIIKKVKFENVEEEFLKELNKIVR